MATVAVAFMVLNHPLLKSGPADKVSKLRANLTAVQGVITAGLEGIVPAKIIARMDAELE